MRRTVMTFLPIVACSVGSVAAHGIDVPISVDELAPQGVAGRNRSAQVVSAGVPLSSSDGITNVGQLGLAGTSAAQFRVLHRDPNTNEIKWVLATFIATHPGGPYALSNGSGAFGGGNLATDQGARIVVNTGAATFEVRKSGFNLLDRVVHGGTEIVAPHAGGGVVLMDGGIRYESSRDAASDTVLEENGPVMAVVRSRGVLLDAGSNRHVGYTARLHFYKGMSRCRAFVTLTNGELASLSSKTFDSAWVEVPLELNAPRDVRFGFPAGDFEDQLAGGEAAHLFQGDNTFQRNNRTDWLLPYMCTAAGLEVELAGVTHNSLGSTGDVAEGWVRIQDNAKAVLAGVRDMATLFPSGFDVQGNVLAVEMFSRHNPLTGLVFSWGCHETREMLFDFANDGANPLNFQYDLQYPLLGRCTFERYRDTGAIYGETGLVTAQEEQDFFADQGQSWSPEVYTENDIEAFRQYSFGTTGGGNQFDKDLTHLLDYLRTDDAGRFLQARLGATWKADQAVYHSDDFDYGARQNGVSNVNVAQPDGFHGKGAGSKFDDEHPHWVNMPVYYYMTGDERIRDAIVDYGEWRRYRAGNPTYGAINGGAISHFRLWSRAFRDVSLLWEFTGEPRYLGDTRLMAEVLTTTIEEGVGRGRNLERGYFYFGDDDDLDRRIHVFFLIEMLPIGAREAMRVLPAGDPWIEEIREFLTGLAWFTLREVQISPDAIGYPYGYYSAIPNVDLGTRGDQTGIILTHGYEMTGDQRFIDEARELAYRVGTYQHELRWSELSTHIRISRWLHRGESGAVLLNPNVQNNGNGTYTLQWTAPADAHEYIVKYGVKPMVENLDFDQVSRTYTHNPATTMNFWAATNLAGEPNPGAEGTTETFTTPVLPGGTWHFKVKALLGSEAVVDPPPPPPPPGDPQACIVWRNADKAKTSLWLLDGTTVLPQSGPLTSMDHHWMVAATGDFNGDGHIDVLWRHLGDGTNLLLLMDETTTLPGSGLLPTLTNRRWTVAGTADFNGDGNTDLLWRHTAKGKNSLWLLDGTTVLPGSGPLPTLKDLDWMVAGTGDFDGDGNGDVLWRHLGDGRNSMWLLDGTTILPGTGPVPTLANRRWSVAATGDFDDDGRSDILWHHLGNGRNSMWLMDGTTILPGSGALPVVDETGWVIAGAADFDGDGYSDVLWRDVETGDNLIWFMDGTLGAPAAGWTTSVGTAWTVAGVGD
jgi:hypothetical protein